MLYSSLYTQINKNKARNKNKYYKNIYIKNVKFCQSLIKVGPLL